MKGAGIIIKIIKKVFAIYNVEPHLTERDLCSDRIDEQTSDFIYFNGNILDLSLCVNINNSGFQHFYLTRHKDRKSVV